MTEAYRPPAGSIPTLDVPNLGAWKRLHLVGAGGAGMSGIARLLLARGFSVSGSDLKDSRALQGLGDVGAEVFVGHRASQIADDQDAVVVSSAIPTDNPEIRRAREAGIPVITRAQVLAALMRGFRAVAVAGTHGKTTTTSMISILLARAGLDPTYVIGGDLNESGSGAGHGTGDVFAAEADESDGSFLLLEPEIAVITNVEVDHIEFYGDRPQLEAAFGLFARRARTVVACRDDPGARRVLDRLVPGSPRIVWYGFSSDADVVVRDVSLEDPAGARATLSAGGASIPLALRVPGRHNLLNAAAAVAVAVELGVEVDAATRALGEFTGVRRRFERRGSAGGAEFVDDYAHHPTEVVATLEAARAVLGLRSLGRVERNGERPAGEDRPGRLVAVFQPHRYTRTQTMWRELGESLAGADLAVLTDVYPAGEPPIPGVTGKLVVEALTEAAPGKRVVYLPRRWEVAPFLAREVRAGDLVMTLGAGDITMVGDETLQRIQESPGGRAGQTERKE
jgi:UDP-N-acetylmuramate--alanine ligase